MSKPSLTTLVISDSSSWESALIYTSGRCVPRAVMVNTSCRPVSQLTCYLSQV